MMNFDTGLSVIVCRDRRSDPLGSGLFLLLKQYGHPLGEGGVRPMICSNIVFERYNGQESASQQMCTPGLTEQAAQALMESLWDAGVRPSQAAGSIGQLAAVEKHLADMREIARSKLGLLK